MDLTGPLTSGICHRQTRHAINFVDDYSRFVKVYTMKRKSDALNKFKQFMQTTDNQPHSYDKGGEFESTEWKQFGLDRGIRQDETITRTLEQNGRSEKILENSYGDDQSHVGHRQPRKRWWGRAIIFAAEMINRSLNSVTETTPYKLFTGLKPNLANLRTFGSKVFIHNDHPNRGKLDQRGIEGIFIGYGEHTKGWIVYLPGTDKIIITRNARFLEAPTRPNFEFEVEESPKIEPPQPQIEIADEEPNEEPLRFNRGPVAPPVTPPRNPELIIVSRD